MRYLDQKLDRALDRAYEALSRRSWNLLRIFGYYSADLRRVAELQVDNALLFEGVNNTLKLLCDQYLARVYALANRRFHIGEWDTSILRKLQTLESIYEKNFRSGREPPDGDIGMGDHLFDCGVHPARINPVPSLAEPHFLALVALDFRLASRGLTVRTGQEACLTTFSATLPISSLLTPVRP